MKYRLTDDLHTGKFQALSRYKGIAPFLKRLGMMHRQKQRAVRQDDVRVSVLMLQVETCAGRKACSILQYRF